MPRKNIPPAITSVEVDLGGTWLRLRGTDARGKQTLDIKRPAVPPRGLPSELKKIFNGRRLNPKTLLVGSKGVWKPAPRRRMARGLAGLSDQVTVMSDVELAYEKTLGKAVGVLLLAGTGSIALAKDARGRWHRAGGLGPEKGDDGSAYWIGREYARRALGKKVRFSKAQVRKTASLAKKVLAARENPVNAAILREAAGHLAAIAAQAARAAHLRKPVPLAWFGGLMQQSTFRKKVLAAFPRALEPTWARGYRSVRGSRT